MACSKIHKKEHESKEDSPREQQTQHAAAAASPQSIARLQPTVTGKDPYNSFLASKDLQSLLIRYPNLKSQLAQLYKTATQPPREDRRSRWRGGSSGRGKGRNEQRAAWTPKRGEDVALKRLTRMRGVGHENEGMSEFIALAGLFLGPDQLPR